MKRILSLFVACFMLVSVFAIGATSVAAETTSWTMPTDWSTGKVQQYKGWDIPVQGAWSFKSYTDLGDLSTAITNDDANIVQCGSVETWVHDTDKGKSPYPYMGTDNNETQVQNKTVSNYYHATNWYVNHGQRWGGVMFKAQSSTAIAFCADNEQKGAILFTAPEAGTYTYTETVAVLLDQLTDGTPLTYEITVRKNGTALDTFVPTDKNAKTLSGEVELAAGDLLMFAFEQTSHKTLTASNAGGNDPACVSISNVTVAKKTATGGEVTPPPSVPAETKWDLPTDWRETDVKNAAGWELPIKGNWELLSYNDADGNPEDIFKAAPIGINNTVTSTGEPQPFLAGYKYSAGMSSTGWYLNHNQKWSEVGGAIKGASYGGKDVVSPNVHKGPVAIAFTAPADGTYDFKEALVVTNFQSSNGTTIAIGALVLKYSGGNVTVLDSFVSSTTAASEKTFTGSVELAKGDKILFAFYNPLDTAPEFVNNAATEKDFYGCFITECTVEVAADDGDDNTGEGGEVTPPSGGTTNPDTSDNLVLAVSALMLAAAGVVIASKKRR